MGLKGMNLLCVTHTLAPVGAHSTQILARTLCLGKEPGGAKDVT